MGERLRKLTIEAFRGVPARWEIAWPSGESMVIWGPNGTGKSTVADALEWYYGGRIDFLAHEGRERALRNQAADRALPMRVAIETDGGSGGARSAPATSSAGPWANAGSPTSSSCEGGRYRISSRSRRRTSSERLPSSSECRRSIVYASTSRRYGISSTTHGQNA